MADRGAAVPVTAVVALAGAVLVGAIGLVIVLNRSHGGKGLPVRPVARPVISVGNDSAVTQLTTVGHGTTYAVFVETLTHRPVTIVGIRFRDLPPHMRFLGSLGVPLTSPTAPKMISATDYPPSAREDPSFAGLDHAPPAAGMRLPQIAPPEPAVELLMGVSITRPGRYVAAGLTIDYRVGGHLQRQQFNDSFTLCTFEPCKAPPL